MANQLQVLKSRQDDMFESMAKILGAMAAPVRLRLIYFLTQSPLTVEVLANKIDQSIANTSMHLRKMLAEGIVSVESVGQKRLYTLDSSVFDFWESYQDFAQKLNPALKMEVEDLYGDIAWRESDKVTKDLFKKNELIFLDVRPFDESEGHDFVHHIPQSELKDNLSKLPKRKKIIVFCRGRLCGISAYSVNYLRENGFKAYRLEQSWTRLKENIRSDYA
jgi:DNA-binding transcriptional ArsR family regulator